MRVEIMIVSFRRDLEFLRFCLRSIRKYATGFAAVRVVVPNVDIEMFRWVETFGARLHGYDEHPENGMLHHEFQKMTADLWCPEADVILHLDSDVMVWSDVTPDDYLFEGRPILFRESFKTVVNKLRLNWQTAVDAAIGITPEYDGMVRFPILHIRETYAKAREMMVAHTGKPVEEYILSCRNTFPQSFCEFCTLSEVAIRHFSDRYQFVEYDVRTPDGGYDYQRWKDKCVAFWSHGGADRYRGVSEEILK